MAVTATNFGLPTVLAESNAGGVKKRLVSRPGPVSYSAGGAEFDCSSSAIDGFGNEYDGFTVVYGVTLVGLAPSATASNTTYKATYLPAAAYAAATGLVKLDHLLQATPAENATADLSLVLFLFEITGR